MGPEGNHNTGKWIAGAGGTAFGLALLHQVFTAPAALADDKLPATVGAGTSVVQHEDHTGDVLDRYKNQSDSGEPSSSNDTGHTSSAPSTEQKKPVMDINDSDPFGLPVPEMGNSSPVTRPQASTSVVTPQKAAPMATASQNKADKKPNSPAATSTASSPVAPTPATPPVSSAGSAAPSSETRTPSSSQPSSHPPINKNHHSPSSAPARPTVPTTDLGDTSPFGLPIPSLAPTPAPAPQAPTPAANGGYPNSEANFSQHDPAWNKVPYGARGDIDQDGCGPTAMADVVDTLTGKKLTPADTAEYLKEHNGVTAGGDTKWDALAQAYTDQGLKHQEFYKPAPYADGTNFINLDIVKQIIAQGGRIEINGRDLGPHDDPATPATTGGHFIVIRGVTPDGKLLVSDPNSAANGTKAFDPNLIFGPATYAIAVYPSASVPAPAPQPAPAPAPSSPPAPSTAPTSAAGGSPSSHPAPPASHHSAPENSTDTDPFDLPTPSLVSPVNWTDTNPFDLPTPTTAEPAPAPAPVESTPAPSQTENIPPEVAQAKPLLDVISIGESHGNYDAYFGHGGNVSNPPLTQMTVGQVLNFQVQYLNNGSPSSAMGKYQILHKTLVGLVNQLHLDLNTKFDQGTQDTLAYTLLVNRGLNDYLSGRISLPDYAHSIAEEWASLPSFTGPHPQASVYDGDGLNHSLISVAQIQQALTQVKH